MYDHSALHLPPGLGLLTSSPRGRNCAASGGALRAGSEDESRHASQHPTVRVARFHTNKSKTRQSNTVEWLYEFMQDKENDPVVLFILLIVLPVSEAFCSVRLLDLARTRTYADDTNACAAGRLLYRLLGADGGYSPHQGKNKRIM